MTELSVNVDGAEGVGKLVSHVKDLTSIVKSSKDEMAELVNERDIKMADLEDEVKMYGDEFADTRAKLDELNEEFVNRFKELEPALNQIDQLGARLDTAMLTGSEGEKSDAWHAQAVEFFQMKHYNEHGAKDNAPDFDVNSVDSDMVEGYRASVKAFDKIFRMKSNIQNATSLLSPEEQKAISTLNYGSEYAMSIEMSNRMIECWEDDTAFESAFDLVTIGKESVAMMVDYDEEADGVWNCETDCSPKPGVDPVQMGYKIFTTGELATEHCVTNRALDDLEIDVQKMIVDSVSRKFQKLERQVYMTGDGVQKPEGILQEGNHVDFASNTSGSLPPGQFGWEDLVAMYWKFPQQFKGGASWWFHEDALVSLFTMKDADGNPIMSQNAFAMSGMPRLMGKPVFENTYMPSYIDQDPASPTFKQPIAGSHPVALGNWREGYLRVNRKAFSIFRDPYSKARCGVVWHIRRRFGGGVKCPNAMWFLTIQ